jgi:hypothetical protein
MPANTDPIFTKSVELGSVRITAGNTSSDGNGTIGTDLFLVETADATNGGFVRKVELMPTASVANTATTATVGRVFISNVSSGATTNANTYLYREVTLGVITAASSSAAVFPQVVVINEGLAAGQSILVSTHAAPAANTAWRATSFSGNY